MAGGVRQSVYGRILLKLSGEALMGDGAYGIEPKIIEHVAREISSVHRLGVDIAIVIGGGNIFRGVSAASQGMDRATADYMGMLATVINALALQQALEREGSVTRVQSAINMKEVAEPYIRRRALRHIEKGRIVIFAAGTGLPFFTTDTAAALRAVEIGADILMKATKVDGVYESDPTEDPSAMKFDKITFTEVLRKNLKVMDATAVSLARDHQMPILVFSLRESGNILKGVMGESVGTLVEGGGYAERSL